jgi:hypothetical protein
MIEDAVVAPDEPDPVVEDKNKAVDKPKADPKTAPKIEPRAEPKPEPKVEPKKTPEPSATEKERKSRLALGRNYQKNNAADLARGVYLEIIKKYPDTPEAATAREWLEEIVGQ